MLAESSDVLDMELGDITSQTLAVNAEVTSSPVVSIGSASSPSTYMHRTMEGLFKTPSMPLLYRVYNKTGRCTCSPEELSGALSPKFCKEATVSTAVVVRLERTPLPWLPLP